MDKVLVILLPLLTGCSVQFNSWELALVDRDCKQHGGVSLIYWSFPLAVYGKAICMDGTTINLADPAAQ
jgi:hypothetical protein